MDIQVTLCLACSSSLPPARSPLLSSQPKRPRIFITRCCNRPICPACVSSNPRLARYDPCLACLGGAAVVDRRNHTDHAGGDPSRNIDGAVRDEDTFVLGDDDDEEIEDLPQGAPADPTNSMLSTSHDNSRTSPPLAFTNSPTSPARYYIKPNDTLQGLAFRFGVEGRELCRLNNLPSSTLSTTPHLLHTRTSIVLPPSARAKLGQQGHDKEIENRRARERAEKRLQMLTKEVDWRVAKAYVALADDPEETAEYEMKCKEGHESSRNIARPDGGPSLEMVAIDKYLEDEEWEERERRYGNGPQIQGLVNLRLDEKQKWNWWKFGGSVHRKLS